MLVVLYYISQVLELVSELDLSVLEINRQKGLCILIWLIFDSGVSWLLSPCDEHPFMEGVFSWFLQEDFLDNFLCLQWFVE